MVSEFPPPAAGGISLWPEHGPCATRYYAASLYAQDSGFLPSSWGWVAQSPNVRNPPLFYGAFGSVREHSPSLPLPSAKGETETRPELKVNWAGDVAHPDEDLLTRRRHTAPSR